jgi:membrane protein DedA with SNARE-associated domain
MSRRKDGALDAFIDSINRTGGSSSIWVAILFIAGGLLSSYMGFSERYLPTMFGGPLVLLIGAIILYKSLHKQQKKRRSSRS